MYKQIAVPFFFLLVVAFTFFAVYRMRKPKEQRLSSKRSFISLLFLWYLCAVAALTIVPLRDSRTQNLPNHINLKPVLRSYHRFFDINNSGDPDAIRNFYGNFFGNIIMFIPLGIFLVWLYNKSLGKVALIGFLASVAIESIQYLNMFAGYYRYVDVDDVILNTLGAIIGYWIYKKFLHARRFTRL